jgi:glutathione S-transferase
MESVQIVGRSSSHFTRVTTIFAHELGVPFQLVPVADLTSVEPALYGGNPAMKIPILRRAGGALFGAENISRALAGMSTRGLRIVWPEQLADDLARNAQELVWHAMSAQVQLVLGTMVAKLPPDNVYFVKARQGFEGSLRWLDGHVARVLELLPPRDVSLFEVTLFCLIEHARFRETFAIDSLPSLTAFAAEFASRQSAERTRYHFDINPREL